MTTFQAGLNNPNLIFPLGKTPLTSMTDLLFKAQKYMNREDALIAKELTGKRKKDENIESQDKKKERKYNLMEAKTSKSGLDTSSKKKLNFTFLLLPVDKILMQIKGDPALKWPKPLSSSSKRRDTKKYHHFHKDHGENFKSLLRKIIKLASEQRRSILMTIRKKIRKISSQLWER